MPVPLDPTAPTAPPAPPEPTSLSRIAVDDDFTGRLDVAGDVAGDADGEGAAWRLRPAGDLPDGDGIVRTGPEGLRVTPTAVNPATGEAAFADPGAPLGEMDKLRWGLLTGTRAADGRYGHDVPDDGWLEISARMSAQGHGLDAHPYGPELGDPRLELKVGAAMLVAVDVAAGLVLDLVLTDGCVLAVYERLAFPGTTHGGFSYAVPVARRSPDDVHELRIRYDRAAGSAAWWVDGAEALRVDDLGERCLPGRYLKRDNGKPASPARPAQLDVGVATFTDRVWGQGVSLRVRRLTVAVGGQCAATGTERLPERGLSGSMP